MAGALFEFLLRQGDNVLVLGHRLSEWCGKAPVLEEDIALANTALDLIGQARLWLALAAEVEGEGRSADDLAYSRDVRDFRNLLLVEQPNGDFGHTIMRQFLFDAWQVENLKALQDAANLRVAGIAEKSLKEALYHFERSRGVVIALGDGTEHSHARMQAALNLLWLYTGELFAGDEVDRAMIKSRISPDLAGLRASWNRAVEDTLREATLSAPDCAFTHRGGKDGRRHGEHLGHMLAVMQFLPRAYPDAQW